MVTRTLLKTVARMFKRHLARFLSLMFVVLVSVGFISGFGMTADKIETAIENYYSEANIADLHIKSTSLFGFTENDIARVKELFPGADIGTAMTFDIKSGERRSTRYQFCDLDELTVNKLRIVDGKMAEGSREIYVELEDNVKTDHAPGEEVTLDLGELVLALTEQYGIPSSLLGDIISRLPELTFTVAAVVQSPLLISRDGEPSYNNAIGSEMPDSAADVASMDLIERVYYIPMDAIPTYGEIFGNDAEGPADALVIAPGDIFVAFDDRTVFDSFSKDYSATVEAARTLVSENLPATQVITLYENYGLVTLNAYGEKLTALSYIVMVAFLLVTMLISFSTMTRLLDEERSQIACLVTLGYTPRQIISRYIVFALLAVAVGGAAAYFVAMGVSAMVYTVFWTSFSMPTMPLFSSALFYIVSLVLIAAGSLAVTAISGFRATDRMPAELLRPKAPKDGRKVFLEKLPRLWNKLPFRYKSTLRNLLRYLNRFIMTVVSVEFSAGLVLSGLALLDLCLFHMTTGTAALVGIAVMIIVFAGLLTAVVIYTLTNISISERNREIATLMVLGYTDSEVTAYIYREIYINCFLGTLIGYPVGSVLTVLLYQAIGFGAIGEVSWFMWLAPPLIMLLFTLLVTLMLRRKILAVNMNESLKSVE